MTSFFSLYFSFSLSFPLYLFVSFSLFSFHLSLSLSAFFSSSLPFLPFPRSFSPSSLLPFTPCFYPCLSALFFFLLFLFLSFSLLPDSFFPLPLSQPIFLLFIYLLFLSAFSQPLSLSFPLLSPSPPVVPCPSPPWDPEQHGQGTAVLSGTKLHSWRPGYPWYPRVCPSCIRRSHEGGSGCAGGSSAGP